MAGDAFCTGDDVKEHTKVGEGFLGFEDKITRHIAQASQLVKNFARREFVRAAFTEYFDLPKLVQNVPFGQGTGQPFGKAFRITIKEFPIVGTPDIRISFNQDWDNTDALVAPDSYFIQDANKGIIVLKVFNPCRAIQAVRVVYTGGYLITALPQDVIDATAIHAAFALRRQEDDQTAQNVEEGRPIPTTMDPGAAESLVPEARRLVARYRRTFLGGY